MLVLSSTFCEVKGSGDFGQKESNWWLMVELACANQIAALAQSSWLASCICTTSSTFICRPALLTNLNWFTAVLSSLEVTKPSKWSKVTKPFPSQRVESGDETNYLVGYFYSQSSLKPIRLVASHWVWLHQLVTNLQKRNQLLLQNNFYLDYYH